MLQAETFGTCRAWNKWYRAFILVFLWIQHTRAERTLSLPFALNVTVFSPFPPVCTRMLSIQSAGKKLNAFVSCKFGICVSTPCPVMQKTRGYAWKPFQNWPLCFVTMYRTYVSSERFPLSAFVLARCIMLSIMTKVPDGLNAHWYYIGAPNARKYTKAILTDYLTSKTSWIGILSNVKSYVGSLNGYAFVVLPGGQ